MSTYIAPPKVNENYDLTMDQLFGLYKDHICTRLKESSQYDFEHNYNKHIAPTFGNNKVAKITKQQILAWQGALSAQNYKYKFKNKLRGLLSAIFKFGVMYYDVPFNVVQQVENFRNLEEKKEIQLWSVGEFKQFIIGIDDNILYKTLFTFLYYTGCRKGEVFALNWNDINIVTKTLSITKSLTRKAINAPYKVTTPKNKSSNRKILIPQVLIDILLEYKATLLDFDCTDFVFGGKTPLSENTPTRMLKKYCEKASVKVITMHDFRHSHASLLISMGENVVMVSKRLGHANIEQTLNTYSHLMPSDEQNMVERLNTI